VDSTIQAYLRSVISSGTRDTERVGPFLAGFDRSSDHPYLSYAVPEDGAEPTAEDVAALRGAFERRGRVPRLEYLPSVAPAAQAPLLAGGFIVEGDLPLMTCAPGEAPDLAPPDGVELVLATSDEDLRAGGAVANAAFGEPGEPGPKDLERTRRFLHAGGLAVMARERDNGEAVGWGVYIAPRDGATELAGIGVAESHRRRGIAGAITARLAREAFSRGVTTAFLTPGDDGAERVYARAGFAPRTRMLHLRVPDEGASEAGETGA
jgi:GNAT superfamily N-acetyltransferase